MLIQPSLGGNVFVSLAKVWVFVPLIYLVRAYNRPRTDKSCITDNALIFCELESRIFVSFRVVEVAPVMRGCDSAEVEANKQLVHVYPNERRVAVNVVVSVVFFALCCFCGRAPASVFNSIEEAYRRRKSA